MFTIDYKLNNLNNIHNYCRWSGNERSTPVKLVKITKYLRVGRMTMSYKNGRKWPETPNSIRTRVLISFDQM